MDYVGLMSQTLFDIPHQYDMKVNKKSRQRNAKILTYTSNILCWNDNDYGI